MTDDTVSGTFLVTDSDGASVVLRDVRSGQIFTLADGPPALDTGDVVTGTLIPESPLGMPWKLADLEEHRQITVERSSEGPTRQATQVGTDQAAGAITRLERAGTGEVHVLTVPPERTEDAAAEIADDEETVARAARLEVDRVEIRAADGIISVRYLP